MDPISDESFTSVINDEYLDEEIEFTNQHNSSGTQTSFPVTPASSTTSLYTHSRSPSPTQSLERTVLNIMADKSDINDSVLETLQRESNQLRDDYNKATTAQNDMNSTIIDVHKTIIDMTRRQNDLQIEQAASFKISAKRKHLRDLLQQITHSDGLIVHELLAFCDTVDLAAKSSNHVLDNNEYLWLAQNASKGELHKEIVEYVSTHALCMWEDVKLHILKAFVGPNATDVFRQQLDTFKQSPTETIPAFNRRFKSLATRAYPKKTPDVERIVLKNYVKAIRDPHIVTRLYNGRDNPEIVEEAMATVEKIYATLSQLESIGVTIAHDQIEFGPTESNKTQYNQKLDNTNDKINKQSTELEKCRIQLQQMKTELSQLKKGQQPKYDFGAGYRPPPNNTQYHNQRGQFNVRGTQPNGSNNQYRQQKPINSGKRYDFRWADDGRPICFLCKGVGHIQRFCRSSQMGPKN